MADYQPPQLLAQTQDLTSDTWAASARVSTGESYNSQGTQPIHFDIASTVPEPST
jgi:hypothetical protein